VEESPRFLIELKRHVKMSTNSWRMCKHDEGIFGMGLV
jgi:hypothetical protein